jgi:hypothetical protein
VRVRRTLSKKIFRRNLLSLSSGVNGFAYSFPGPAELGAEHPAKLEAGIALLGVLRLLIPFVNEWDASAQDDNLGSSATLTKAVCRSTVERFFWRLRNRALRRSKG